MAIPSGACRRTRAEFRTGIIPEWSDIYLLMCECLFPRSSPSTLLCYFLYSSGTDTAADPRRQRRDRQRDRASTLVLAKFCDHCAGTGAKSVAGCRRRAADAAASAGSPRYPPRRCGLQAAAAPLRAVRLHQALVAAPGMRAETATGPVQGYLANRAMGGTKTRARRCARRRSRSR